MLDLDIAVLGPAERLETLAECNDASQHFGIVLGIWMQECDAPHALALLRARHERPRGRAAEQGDELAAFHVAPLPWQLAQQLLRNAHDVVFTVIKAG